MGHGPGLSALPRERRSPHGPLSRRKGPITILNRRSSGTRGDRGHGGGPVDHRGDGRAARPASPLTAAVGGAAPAHGAGGCGALRARMAMAGLSHALVRRGGRTLAAWKSSALGTVSVVIIGSPGLGTGFGGGRHRDRVGGGGPAHTADVCGCRRRTTKGPFRSSEHRGPEASQNTHGAAERHGHDHASLTSRNGHIAVLQSGLDGSLGHTHGTRYHGRTAADPLSPAPHGTAPADRREPPSGCGKGMLSPTGGFWVLKRQ